MRAQLFFDPHRHRHARGAPCPVAYACIMKMLIAVRWEVHLSLHRGRHDHVIRAVVAKHKRTASPVVTLMR